MKTSRWRLLFWLLALLAVPLLLVLALTRGPVDIPVWASLQAAWQGETSTEIAILLDIRLPRAVLALLVGAALGLAGAAMQGLLRNPLADPGVLGISAAAALGAVITLYFGWSTYAWFVLPVSGLGGALLAVLLILLLSGQRGSDLTLILAGLAVSSFAGALIALALNLAPSPYAISEIVHWMLGSVANRHFLHVQMLLPFLLAGGAVLLASWRFLEALSLGEETAQALGFHTRRWRWLVVAGVAACVGAAVSVSGVIGFVGLMVPHLVRPLVRHRPGILLPASALMGGLLLLVADQGLQLLPGRPLQLGVVTALLGAPFFFWLVLHHRLRWPS